MAGGKATASASGPTKEKTRKQREDGEVISDTADEGHPVKKKKVNSAQSCIADERADDLRLAEKALFTRAVFLTQRLASCLHASAKIIKGPRALSQVEAIQKAWATVQSYVSKDDLDSMEGSVQDMETTVSSSDFSVGDIALLNDGKAKIPKKEAEGHAGVEGLPGAKVGRRT